MASSYESFKQLDLNRDEVERLESALKDKEFRKLLGEYVDELRDPENQKIYQSEITQLEKERGVDVTFINPVAGYVIKTSANGSKKCFINICSNEKLQKPTSSPKSEGGSRGLQWSLPHSFTPPREDVDKKGVRCQVFDVVFHPDTLHLAQNNKAFRNMVNTTACNGIETNFDVSLDKKNLKFPKLNYKGMMQAAVVRKPSKETPPPMSPEEQEFLNKIYDTIPKPEATASPKKSRKSNRMDMDNINSSYTTPKYVMKHRSHIELEEFTENKSCKLNSAIPKELVIEVNLPLLKTAADIVLDVAEKTLHLTSEKPAKYKLSLTLPYHVNQDNGNAKFDKDMKKIIITLPVKRHTGLVLTDFSRDDSGVESDHGSPVQEEDIEEPYKVKLVEEIQPAVENACSEFLNPNISYNIPEYTCQIFDNVLTFTCNIRNVDEHTVEKMFDNDNSSVHVKFISISSSFYPIYYAIYIKLHEINITVDDFTIETWDNNVVIQLPYTPCDKIINSCLIGLSEKDAKEECIASPLSTIAEVKKDETEKCDNSNDSSTSDYESNPKDANELLKSRAIHITGAISESSGDEWSASYSPGRGILKRLSATRSSVSRSISESSIDDLMWTSSFENCQSLDSVIPENAEMSTSLKKSVRFSNVVSRQVFRCNSSILGQKRKNQRKAKNKKKAQGRRHSESELSEEHEDKEEGDTKTTLELEELDENIAGNEFTVGSNDEDCTTKDDHIFDLDI